MNEGCHRMVQEKGQWALQPQLLYNRQWYALRRPTTWLLQGLKWTISFLSLTRSVLCLGQCWCILCLNAALLLFHALCDTIDMSFLKLLNWPSVDLLLLWQCNAIPIYTGRVEYMKCQRSQQKLLYLSMGKCNSCICPVHDRCPQPDIWYAGH